VHKPNITESEKPLEAPLLEEEEDAPKPIRISQAVEPADKPVL